MNSKSAKKSIDKSTARSSNIFTSIKTKLFKDKTLRTDLIIAALIGILSFALRIYFAKQYNLYLGDQAYHGHAINQIREGHFVLYGSTNSLRNFVLFPLHYYTNAIFAFVFGGHPITHVFANTFFCGITAIFLFFTLRKVTAQNQYSQAISGFISFLYAIAYFDIFQASFEWNPNTLAFFALALAVCAYNVTHHLIATSQSEKNTEKKSKPLYTNTTIWWGVGFAFAWAMLCSLHATGLYSSTIFSVLILLYLSYKKQLATIGTIIGSFVLFTFPYWIGEIQNLFNNSLRIAYFSIHGEGDPVTLLARFARMYSSAVAVISNVAFLTDLQYVSTFFTFALLTILLLRYSKIHPIVQLYMLLSGIYFAVMSSYSGVVNIHYLGVVQVLPFFVLAVAALYAYELITNAIAQITKPYFEFRNLNLLISPLVVVFIIVGYVGFFGYCNAILLKRFNYLSYNAVDRSMTIWDKQDALNKYATESVCYPWAETDEFDPYRLLNETVTKKDLKFYIKDCPVNSIIILEKNMYPSGAHYLDGKTSQIPPSEYQYEVVEDNSIYSVVKIVQSPY